MEYKELIKKCKEYHNHLVDKYDIENEIVKIVISFYNDILTFDFTQDDVFDKLCQLKKDNLLKCNDIYNEVIHLNIRYYAFSFDNILGLYLDELANKNA